jgi:multiple antibiotic resistance protein
MNLALSLSLVLKTTIYFLALINPASKILFLSTKTPPYQRQELVSISTRSSFVAWIICILMATAGNFILLTIFHVEIYSLSAAGGIILFIIGLTAVRKGRFYEKNELNKGMSEISIVPLAAPLIVGPGIITAVISFAAINGILVASVCVTIALFINLLFMLASLRIGRFLERTNATGPMIRITGLIVTAVAMQMIFSGVAMWMNRSLP